MLRRAALFLCLTAVSFAALPPGYPVPDVLIPRLLGKKIDLKQYRGKAVVLALISTDCQDCALTVELLNMLQDEDGPKGLQVGGAAGDENAASNLFYLEKQNRPKYPLGYLDPPSFIKIAGLLPTENPFVPILIFIDPKGIMRVKIKG